MRVRLERREVATRVGRAAPAAPLVEEDDAVAAEVEEVRPPRRGARARAAVEHDAGHTVRRAVELDVERMPVADLEAHSRQPRDGSGAVVKPRGISHPALPPMARLLASTRTRVLLAFVVVLASSTVLSLVVLRELLLSRVSDRVDAQLTQEVEEFRRLAPERDLRAVFDAYFERNVPGPGETVVAIVDGRVYGQRSSERGGSPRLGPLVPRWDGLTGTERGNAGHGRRRGPLRGRPDHGRGRARHVRRALRAGRRARGGHGRGPRRRARARLRPLLAAALAWVLAGRILAPLRELRETARSITQTDITRRIPVTGSDEIAELARTFNAMLDRLEASFASMESAVASQRAFVSDASHELRTPITIVRGHLELLGGDPEERRETISLVTDELDRMSRFVDDLLVLAKAEREDFLHVAPLELGALTDELLDKATALGRREWRLEERGERLLHADRQRLTQAVMGLAQNAVEHTGEGDPIWLGSAADGDAARLWVRDAGPGVPDADRERIFERFARARGSARRSEGAGLGLSIVRAIAEAHGGRVELSGDEGRGSTFTVVLPADGHP